MRQLLFVATIVIFASCENDPDGQQKTIGITAIPDVTDQHLAIQSKAILKLFRCDQNQNAAFHFRLKPISNVVLAPEYESHLKNEEAMRSSNTTDDPQYRAACIKQFYQNTSSIIDSFYQSIDSVTLSSSECIRGIFSEISLLQAKHYDESFVVVSSDLMEHTDVFDFYSRTPSFESFDAYLVNEKLIPESLKRMTVIFIFKPTTRTADQNFHRIFQLFKQAIEQRGGKVIIQSQNRTFNI